MTKQRRKNPPLCPAVKSAAIEALIELQNLGVKPVSPEFDQWIDAIVRGEVPEEHIGFGFTLTELVRTADKLPLYRNAILKRIYERVLLYIANKPCSSGDSKEGRLCDGEAPCASCVAAWALGQGKG